MEDLGEPEETQIDFFRCVEKPHTSLPSAALPSFPHHSLLAVSSRYGFLFRAFNAQIHVYSLDALRKNPVSSTPHVSVDLTAYGVSAVLSVALVLRDSALLTRVREGNTSGVRILSTAGVVAGKAVWDGGIDASGRNVLSVGVGFGEDREKVALLKEGGDVEVCALQEGAGVKGSKLDGDKLQREVALCVAVCPEEELVAVGTESGSVYLYDADTLERRMEIVVVESGWLPFALAFLTSEDVMVSYACEDMVNHVVWTIGEDQRGSMATVERSMLGELCYPALPSLPNSEDEAEVEDKVDKNSNSKPIVFCCPVPGWAICAVASSFSSDIEFIAKKEGGKWENWKFDEGKSAVLPTNDDDYDTKPLGVALDMTDTEEIDALDPSAPKIHPMPRLIVLTTAFKFIPFTLIDDRPGASCEFVREPLSLPPLLKDATAASVAATPSVRFETIGAQIFKDANPIARSTAMPSPFGCASSSAKNPDLKQGAMPMFNFIPGSGLGSQEMQNFFSVPAECVASPGRQSDTSGFRPEFSLNIQKRRAEEEFLSSDEELGEDSDADDEDNGHTGSVIEDEESEQGSMESATAKSSFPTTGFSFTETESFLSNFKFAEASNEQRRRSTDTTLRSSALPTDFGPEIGVPSQSDKVTSSNLPPVSLPAYPPHPSFEEVSVAVNEGKPEDLIRSVLIEMRQELDYNRNAFGIMKKRLEATDEALRPKIENVKNKLTNALSELREHFRQEVAFRRDMFSSLKEMMGRSKEFESMSLEFRIREDESFTQGIRTEDRAFDEEISKKENAIAQSLSSIENRVYKERMSKNRHESQTERIQQMYSSLSLQGIRIRRICSFLSALSSRVDKLEEGGRRCDLGLSVARLQKLSLGDPGKNTLNGFDSSDSPAIDSFRIGEGGDLKSPDQNHQAPDVGEESPTASREVLTVLRRLAMRGGRANITARSSRSQFEEKSNSQEVNSGGIDDNDVRQADLAPDAGRNIRFPKLNGNIKNPYQLPTSTSGFTPSLRQETITSKNVDNKKRRQSNRESVRSTPSLKEPNLFSLPKRDSDLSLAGSSSGSKITKKPSSLQTNPNDFLEGNDTENATSQLSKSLFGKRKEVKFSFASPGSHVFDTNKDSKKSFSGQRRVEPAFKFQAEVPTPAKERFSSSDLTASLPPDEFVVKKEGGAPFLNERTKTTTSATVLGKVSVQSSLKSTGPSKVVETGSKSIAQSGKEVKNNARPPLPPDENVKTSQLAPLPPDDGVTTSSRALSLSNENVRDNLSAPLPPDENLKDNALTASSQDVELKAKLAAPLPPDEFLKDKKTTETREGLPPQPLFGSFSKVSPGQDNQFAAFPPAPDTKGLSGSKVRNSDVFGLNSSSVSFGKFGESLQLNSSSASTQKDEAISRAGSGQSEKKSLFGSTTAQLPLASSSTLFGNDRTKKIADASQGAGGITGINRTSSDDSETEDKKPNRPSYSMDTSSQDHQDGFGSFTASRALSSGYKQSSGIFGAAPAQEASSKEFGQSVMNGFGNSSNAQNDDMQDANPGLFGTSGSLAGGQTIFQSTTASTSAFGSSTGFFGTAFGASAQFGQSSQIGGGASFSTPNAGGGRAQLGMSDVLGGGTKFGASSQIGVGFGASSQLGAASPFNTSSSARGSTAFGSGAQPFGGVPNASLGVPSFGMNQSGQQTFGESNTSFGGGKPSPFGNTTGSLFGGNSGGSAFAALAASPGIFGGAAGSGFANSGAPVFGTDNGPPAFTSPAFSERRA